MTIPPEQLEAIKRETQYDLFPATDGEIYIIGKVIDHLNTTGRPLPDGCVAVPIEPTEDMLWAAYSVDDCVYEDPTKNRANIYKAMLAAAKGE